MSQPLARGLLAAAREAVGRRPVASRDEIAVTGGSMTGAEELLLTLLRAFDRPWPP
jgi:hypothetical protein